MSDQKSDDTDEQQHDLDYVLNDVGEFGKYQIVHFILMILPIVLSATYAVEFIVTSSTDDYRCRIPECESLNATDYNTDWLNHAIPLKNGRPDKCSRYAASHAPITFQSKHCSPSMFNQSDIINCNQYVFKTDEYRIMREFGILCDENEYKLALVGTINNIGGFLFMPLTGVLSDKFGRLTILIFTMVGCAICGLIKAFVGTYVWYMVFEFVGAAIGTTCYMAAFVLCVEWILLGVAAIFLQNYRTFLVAIYVPALITAFYFWLVPESVRWLIATSKYNRAMTILKRTAKQNNRQISEKSLKIIRNNCKSVKNADNGDGDGDCSSVIEIFRHKILIVRIITCSLCWIMTVFVFYGLSVNATKLADDSNKYLSYITTMISEIPAAFISYWALQYIGRRKTMFCAMATAGSATILSTFIPSQYTFVIRLIFFIGMCATSSAFAVLYVFSAEIWPTPMRNTLMNICSMIGRFGSMMAPLVILLSHYMPTLPLLIFGAAAILSGFIIFLLPETKGKKLPHTIEDARNL